MGQNCIYITTQIIICSSILLIYTNLSGDFPISFHIRFWIFFGQHILIASFLLWTLTFNTNQIGTILLKFLALTSILFFTFLGYEIYLICSITDGAQLFGDSSYMDKSFLGLSYLRLYYQFNVYNGFLWLFCLIFNVYYVVQNRNQERESVEAVQELDHWKYRANYDEESCPICLVRIQRGEDCLKLECSHIFHKECLATWMKQRMTCPICRHNLRNHTLQRNRQNIVRQNF